MITTVLLFIGLVIASVFALKKKKCPNHLEKFYDTSVTHSGYCRGGGGCGNRGRTCGCSTLDFDECNHNSDECMWVDPV